MQKDHNIIAKMSNFTINNIYLHYVDIKTDQERAYCGSFKQDKTRFILCIYLFWKCQLSKVLFTL